MPHLLQAYNQPLTMLDLQSSFAPVVTAAQKKMLAVLGDLEVSILCDARWYVMCHVCSLE